MQKSTNSSDAFQLGDITTYHAGIVQASASRIVNKHTADLLQQYSLTSMQWFLIGVIYEHGTDGIRISDLSKLLDTTMAYTTQMVNMLESRGIVTKRADIRDGRTKWITIVPKYRSKCREIEEALRNHLRQFIYKDITPQELNTYIHVLYKLNEMGGRSNEF